MWTDYSVICCTGLSEQTKCTQHVHRRAHQLPASLKIHGQSQIFASTIPGPNMAAKPTAPEARLSVMFLCLPCTQPVILPQLPCPFASHSTWWQVLTRKEIQYFFFSSSRLSTWPCAFSACCSDPVAITIITYLTRFSLGQISTVNPNASEALTS